MEEQDFEKLLKRVSGAIGRRYRGHSEIEDLIQEGRITAWKYRDSNVDPGRIVWKCLNRAGDLLQRGAYTGKPRKDRQIMGYASGDATREKIKMFMEEYAKLHGKKPTHKQIGTAVGVSDKSVYKQLERMYISAEAVPDADVQIISTDYFQDTSEGIDLYADAVPSFEDDFLLAQEMVELVRQLPEKERTVLFMYFWEDRTHQQIADYLGCKGPESSRQWVKKGINQVKELMGV